jgi:hypothetical protein
MSKSLDVSKAIDKQRDDRHDEALAVTVPMAAAMRACGLRRRDLNRACDLPDVDGGSAQSWTTTDPGGAHKPRVPTVEQWAILRDLLGLTHLDAEVWRLNGRKGTPGEAWATADVLRLDERFNEPNGVVNVGQGERVPVVRQVKAANSTAAERWAGWGTALKPASEPIVVARKPLAGTVAANVQAWGTGALNIDGCRVGTDAITQHGRGDSDNTSMSGRNYAEAPGRAWTGRWPSNVVLSHSANCTPIDCAPDCPVNQLDQQSGVSKDSAHRRKAAGGVLGNGTTHGAFVATKENHGGFDDQGGASRFFPSFTPSVEDAPPFRYQAKAPTSERPKVEGAAHPTVKPLALMRWLVRLVTPPGGTVLEPFAGSGTTVEAAMLEGFSCVAIEREADYLPLIEARIARAEATLAAPPPEPKRARKARPAPEAPTHPSLFGEDAA